MTTTTRQGSAKSTRQGSAKSTRPRSAGSDRRPQGSYRPKHSTQTKARTVREHPGSFGVRGRLTILAVVIAMLAGALILRLVDLQVWNPDRFVAYGNEQRVRTIDLPGIRGEILDRNGEQLGVSVAQTTVFTDPRYIVNPLDEASKLAPVLGMDVETVRNAMISPSFFAYIARRVPDDVAAQVEALDLPGVFTLEEATRFRPAGEDLASSLIGQVGDDHQGLSGVEYAFNDLLEGQAGTQLVERDPQGNTIPVGYRDVVIPQPGSDLVLSIDRSLQFEVEQILMDQVDAMAASGGVVVVTNPASGEILAVANVTRDPGGFARVSVENQALTWAFEPGSVMKAITFAAVLDAGIASPATRIDVPDSYQLYDALFTDSHFHDTESWSVSDIVTQSSNVGTIKWAEKLGASGVDGYFRDFGFGSSTDLGLPGETSGIVLPLEDWSGTSIGSIPLGQGISVSPLQMVAAYNVLANDGTFVPLRLVREVVDADGTRTVPPGEAARQVVSAETARDMRSILTNVVAEGTGTAAAVPGYAVAGKTGTARKPLPGGGYEDADGNFHYVASFIGFLPADAPELSILVTIDEPTVSIYAGDAAAPAFAEISKYALRHYRIPPVGGSDADIDLALGETPARERGVAATADVPASPPVDILLTPVDPGQAPAAVALQPGVTTTITAAPEPVLPTPASEPAAPVSVVEQPAAPVSVVEQPVAAAPAVNSDPYLAVPPAEPDYGFEPGDVEPLFAEPVLAGSDG